MSCTPTSLAGAYQPTWSSACSGETPRTARAMTTRDLALERQQLGALRADDRVAVARERRGRLEEVRGCRRHAPALCRAALVVEVHRDDLGGSRRRHRAWILSVFMSDSALRSESAPAASGTRARSRAPGRFGDRPHRLRTLASISCASSSGYRSSAGERLDGDPPPGRRAEINMKSDIFPSAFRERGWDEHQPGEPESSAGPVPPSTPTQLFVAGDVARRRRRRDVRRHLARPASRCSRSVAAAARRGRRRRRRAARRQVDGGEWSQR